MADERIEDITGGELTTLAADDKMVILDASDTTDDADGTAKYVELATLGAWEHATGTDANTAMAVGTWYDVDMSGWTADRVYSLPSTAAVGDRVAISISTGDDTYEMDLRTASASNDTINGVDHDTTSWSRLFITGEVVIFRCVTANTDWIVEHDGRIPCVAKMRLNTDTTDNYMAVANTLYQVPMDTENFDNCDIVNLTEDHFDIRRDGKYTVHAIWTAVDALTDGELLTVAVSINNNATIKLANIVPAHGPSISLQRVNGYGIVDLANGDTLELWSRASATANLDTAGSATATFIDVGEIL